MEPTGDNYTSLDSNKRKLYENSDTVPYEDLRKSAPDYLVILEEEKKAQEVRYTKQNSASGNIYDEPNVGRKLPDIPLYDEISNNEKVPKPDPDTVTITCSKRKLLVLLMICVLLVGIVIGVVVTLLVTKKGKTFFLLLKYVHKIQDITC